MTALPYFICPLRQQRDFFFARNSSRILLRAGLGAGPRLSRGIEAPAGIPLARRFPGQRSPTPPPIPVAVWRTEDSKGRPVANKLIAAIRYAATPSKLAVANFYVYTSKFTADNSSTLVATKFHHVF